MKTTAVLALAGLVIVLAACGEPAADIQEFPGVTVAQSTTVPRDEHPQVGAGDLAELVQGNANLAADLFGKLSADSEGNVFLSPHSISLALAMTYPGARGQTASQMRSALRFSLSDQALHPAFNALDLSLQKVNTSDGQIQLEVANAVWGQEGWHFTPTYLDLLSRHYGAAMYLLDFGSAPEPSRATINDWVAARTRDRIQDLLPAGSVTELTRLVLTNAVYFYGRWLRTFDERQTRDRDFTTLSGRVVPAPMMSLDLGALGMELPYADEDGEYQALELPYTGERLAMIVLLPAESRYRSFERSLDGARLTAITNALSETTLAEVRLPKFSFTSASISLKPVLGSLGMLDAFAPGMADFSGIDDTTDLFIQDVVHKAFVSVDESGTEAGAATGVIIGVTSAPPPPKRFIADRPFVFLIRDKQTGAILFIGRITNPVQ
jgi:serpin B